jgi:hypothetical protein
MVLNLSRELAFSEDSGHILDLSKMKIVAIERTFRVIAPGLERAYDLIISTMRYPIPEVLSQR